MSDDILDRLESHECESEELYSLIADAAAEIRERRAELTYAYRCITGGYRQGVFDFSQLRKRAFEFTGLEDKPT